MSRRLAESIIIIIIIIPKRKEKKGKERERRKGGKDFLEQRTGWFDRGVDVWVARIRGTWATRRGETVERATRLVISAVVRRQSPHSSSGVRVKCSQIRPDKMVIAALEGAAC